MNKYIKGTLKFVLQILVTTALLLCIDIAMKGMYLIGIPEIEDVKLVTVSYPEVTEEVKQITDGENIGLAVKLSSFLRYAPFREADLSEAPLVTVTYYTADGKTVSVSANRTTVWWKGKPHAIKSGKTFLNLTEGLFFLKDLEH